MWSSEKIMELQVQSLEEKGLTDKAANALMRQKELFFFPKRRDEANHQFNKTGGALYEL